MLNLKKLEKKLDAALKKSTPEELTKWLNDQRKNKPPIIRMVDAAMKCTKCGAGLWKCDCWTKCYCGWMFEKGTKCDNPKHKKKT